MYMFAVFADFPQRENPQNRSLVGIPHPHPGNAPVGGGCASCGR